MPIMTPGAAASGKPYVRKFGKDWEYWNDPMQDKMMQYNAINAVMADVPMTPGYDVVFTSPDKISRYSTGKNGRLVITAVEAKDVKQALAEAKCHVITSQEAKDALADAADDSAVELEMRAKRKIQIHGDKDNLYGLQEEMQKHEPFMDAAAKSTWAPCDNCGKVNPDGFMGVNEDAGKYYCKDCQNITRDHYWTLLDKVAADKNHPCQKWAKAAIAQDFDTVEECLYELANSGGPDAKDARYTIDWVMPDYRKKIEEKKQEYREKNGQGRQVALPSAVKRPIAWQEPEETRMSSTRWIMFSAMSTPSGNMGQGNYTAANIAMDVLTYQSRMEQPQYQRTTLMWGAVGQLGMRWKAFASQDFLLADGGSALFTVKEASQILCGVITTPGPEWFGCMINQEYLAAIASGAIQLPTTKRDHGSAWASAADPSPALIGGLGAAATRWAEFEQRMERPVEEPVPATASAEEERFLPGQASGAYAVGIHVSLFGLRTRPEMNGLTGHLVEDMGRGRWLMVMDDTLVEELFRESNIEIIEGRGAAPKSDWAALASVTATTSDIELTAKPTATASAPPGGKAYCIAGSWDGWVPHDMVWDDERESFQFQALLGRLESETFQVFLARFRDGGMKTSRQTWTIPTPRKDGDEDGVTKYYEIRLYVKDNGCVKDVRMGLLGGSVADSGCSSFASFGQRAGAE